MADIPRTGTRVRRGRGRLRGSILERAADLVSLDGLDQVSIGRLADAMQMSKSGLYSYFMSKQDLQLATIEYAWRIFEERVLNGGDDPLDALLDRWISYYEQEGFAGGCPLATAAIEFANREGVVRDALAAVLERQLTALEHGVARDHATRLLTDTDPRQLAFELHALLAGSNQHFQISGDRTSFARARAAVSALISSQPPAAPRPGRAEGQSAALARSAPPRGVAVGGHPGIRSTRSRSVRAEAGMSSELLGLDCVGLATADAGALQAFLCDHAGMKELERSSRGVVVGADAEATKLRLISSEGPREPGSLARVMLRVGDLQRAIESLPPDIETDTRGPGLVTFEAPEGLRLGFTVASGLIDHDVDHLVLHVADPEETGIVLAQLGFVPEGRTLRVADKHISLEELPGWSERPLLDHIAVRVASIEPIAAYAQDSGFEISDRVSQERVAIVVPGLERIRLDFVALAPPR